MPQISRHVNNIIVVSRDKNLCTNAQTDGVVEIMKKYLTEKQNDQALTKWQ